MPIQYSTNNSARDASFQQANIRVIGFKVRLHQSLMGAFHSLGDIEGLVTETSKATINHRKQCREEAELAMLKSLRDEDQTECLGRGGQRVKNGLSILCSSLNLSSKSSHRIGRRLSWR